MVNGQQERREWDGKVAVITGGARGIGAAVAELGSQAGGHVWIVDTDAGHGQEHANNIVGSGGWARFLDLDVTDEVATGRGFTGILEQSGRIDIVVNSAGRDSDADPATMTVAEWDSFMDLDLKASWLTARAALPSMIERGGGSIVNVASLHATLTAEGSFPYGAAKAGLLGLTRSLALDVGRHGVRVNAVSPGWTLSERVAAHFAHVGEDEARRVRDLHALRRIAEPLEIAEIVVFLASDAARCVTGANWAADAGLGARFA